MTNCVPDASVGRLWPYAVFAGFLASAGLPIYIHAPKFYVDTYGVSLAALGTVLFGLRLLDVVQDPLLGRLAERWRARRGVAVIVGLGIIAAGMVGLFAVSPPIDPLWWFAITLATVFSAFSFLTICFYAQGVEKAGRLGAQGHLRIARWRESGALFGVCAAALAPVTLANSFAAPFAIFAWAFAGIAIWAWAAMAPEWQDTSDVPSVGFRGILQDTEARRLLLLAFVNAAPVAVSSTLFLFFVETRLDAPGREGALLLLFFLSAGLTAPVWTRLAERWGARRVLTMAMCISILAFGYAVFLETRQVAIFAVICVFSGAALGADMTLLPAMFSRRLARIAPQASEAFGLWNFVSKFTLALAAVVLLPALEWSGFSGGAAGTNSHAALWTLSLLYAGLPCVLKAVAIVLLLTSQFEEDR